MKTERELLDNFKKYHNANYHDGDNTFDFRTYRMTEAGGLRELLYKIVLSITKQLGRNNRKVLIMF